MKSQPLRYIDDAWTPCLPRWATHLRIGRPGILGEVTLPVMIGGTRDGTGNWTWNGDVEKPTLKPSIKSETWIGENSCYDDGGPSRQCICHTWITDGRAIFLDDTTHELRGQTVDLIDL